MCAGKGELVGDVSSAASLDVAYCLALCVAPASGQPCLLASAHAGMANKLEAANQDVSNGHRL